MSHSWTSRETREVGNLAELYAKLDPEAPFDNRKGCCDYIKQITVCADHLDLDAVPRDYRNKFTSAYRKQLKDDKITYEINVIKAGLKRCPDLHVNGKACLFTREAVRQADKLTHCWLQLGAILMNWRAAARIRSDEAQLPGRLEMKSVLAQMDEASAAFEGIYIGELIAIEAVARKPLVDAVEQEHCLTLAGSKHKLKDAASELFEFCACLTQLNVVANENCIGQGVLDPQVILAAQKVLQDDSQCSATKENRGLVHTIAQELLDSFQAMREYLRSVGDCMKRVDPHLENNKGLVSHLEDLEKTMRTNDRYIQEKAMHNALFRTEWVIEWAQDLVPDLKRMCLDCDAELFMVLPRLVWLGFLRDPQYDKLLSSLLPDSFGHKEGEYRTPEMTTLVMHFNSIKRALIDAQRPCTREETERAGNAAWDILIHRAVVGAGVEDKYAYGNIPTERQGTCRSAVEIFMRDLEAHSMNLQRHCPKDWNACSAKLVHWISGEEKKEHKVPFHV